MKLKNFLILGLLLSLCWICPAQQGSYKLRLCWIPQAQFAGFFMAEEEGYYAQEGLALEISYPPRDEEMFDTLMAEDADFVMEWFLYALEFKAKGNDIVNVAQFQHQTEELLVAKKSSGIQTIKDLKGRNIGIWFSPQLQFSFKAFLKRNEMNEDDYRVYPILDNISLFLCGGVDVVSVMSFNEYNQILFSGYNPDELTIFPLKEEFPNLVLEGIYCRRETWENNKQDVIALRRATLKGWEAAFKNPEKALQVIKRKCDEIAALHNSSSSRQIYRECSFGYAIQKAMLENFKKNLPIEGNDALMKKETFQEGMNIMGLDESDILFEDFAPRSE